MASAIGNSFTNELTRAIELLRLRDSASATKRNSPLASPTGTTFADFVRSNQIISLRETVMLPTTVDRVPNQTCNSINERIRRDTEERVAGLKDASPAAIEQRLAELNEEWDIERTLEAHAAGAVLVGVGLGATVDRRWFAFPAVVGAFLLQHALHGWCPPLPIFRRLGFRTAGEIDFERYALKALRGDFSDLKLQKRDRGHKLAEKAMRAAEA
jgi:hypothetical protein